MRVQLLKSKLHRATVTDVHLDYEGSCAIDSKLLQAASINEYEMLHIYNLNNGNRFTTYAIKAERNFEMEEFSRSIIESRVNISLPEVEIEEIIQSNNIWYARASLKKNKYYQLLKQKRQNAKDASLNLLIASKINK